MKIVKSSNYDRDDYVESFLDIPSLPTKEAAEIAKIINRCTIPDGDDYYKVVNDDYKLHLGLES